MLAFLRPLVLVAALALFALLVPVGRRMRFLGLATRPWRAATDIGAGALVGSLCVAFTVAVPWLAGHIVLEWRNAHLSAFPALLAYVAIAALAEELLFRGALRSLLAPVLGTPTADAVLGVLFFLAHLLFSPAMPALACLNTALAGWLLCRAVTARGSIHWSWGWHVAWNALLGLFFGLPVSGVSSFAMLLHGSQREGALTGGAYGPEASLPTMMVLTFSLLEVQR
jgi:membrane protease YdiL (CAAX protease family)